MFFGTEHAADAPDFARHLAALPRVRDALALAAPSAAIPDPAISLRLIDIAGEPPVTRRSRATPTRSCCSSAARRPMR